MSVHKKCQPNRSSHLAGYTHGDVAGTLNAQFFTSSRQAFEVQMTKLLTSTWPNIWRTYDQTFNEQMTKLFIHIYPTLNHRIYTTYIYTNVFFYYIDEPRAFIHISSQYQLNQFQLKNACKVAVESSFSLRDP